MNVDGRMMRFFVAVGAGFASRRTGLVDIAMTAAS